MKKVGILVNSIGFGGNERSAVNIAAAVSDRFDVTIIIQEDCGNHYGYKGKVINLNTPCAQSKAGKVLNSIRRIYRLNKIIKEEKLETLFIILPVSNPINYLHFRCKKIVSCRDCGDLIRRTDKYIRMAKSSDIIVCNSVFQADYITKQAPSLAAKTTAIYNIIDIDRIHALKDDDIEEVVKLFMSGKDCIISSGRFANAKGLCNLLKAFSIVEQKNKNARLIMIGDGELRESIERLIRELGIEKSVLLLGFKDNPFKYIAKADVFILPSLYEGFPNTLIEAMACGTPVIAADCPSGPGEILDGKAIEKYEITQYGILLKCFSDKNTSWKPGDVISEHYEMANAIEYLLNDPEFSATLIYNALKRVSDFSPDKISCQWRDIL